jgi:hypothetical protein
MCVWLECVSVAVNMQIRLSIEEVRKTFPIRANRKHIPFEFEFELCICKKNLDPNLVSVSLIYQPKLNAETPVSTLVQHMLQHCFSICHSGVSTYVSALFQHMSQQCFNICHRGVSPYVTALFQHMSQHCLNICLSPVSTYVTTLF